MNSMPSMIVRSILPGMLLAATAIAQPVSKLGGEWWVPPGTTPGRAALVDSASGAVRVVEFSSAGKVAWPHTVATGVAEVAAI